jgi:hypothetical protein
MDIRAASYEDWEFLLEELELHSPYEILVLDLGDGVAELFRILDRCDRIYMPVREDAMSQAKISQFENLIRLWDAIPVLERIQKIKPPFYRNFASGDAYAEQLVWSQLGDYVRGLLAGEKQ